MAGLTLEEASSEVGVNLQAFFLQERGVYPDILPKIVTWLTSKGYSLSDAIIEYHEYQRDRRREYGEQYGLSVLELGEPDDFPFVSFRKIIGLSRMGFAKRFCVHPGLLYRVEMGISKSLPIQLADALRQAGLPDYVILELKFRIEELA